MEAGLPLVTLLALSRKTRPAAGASSSARLLKVAAKIGAGCPSFGGQRTVASLRKQENSPRLSRHSPFSARAPSPASVASRHWQRPAAFHRFQASASASAQEPIRWLRIQPWYASPSKFKARLPPRERGLTLPSSGPAFGGPLTSNVRRHLQHR